MASSIIIEIFLPSIHEMLPRSKTDNNILRQKFSIITSTPVTVCIRT